MKHLVLALLLSLVPRARVGADRRAHVPLSGRVGGPDRVRLCRRHLGRAEEGRHRRPPELAARRGDRSRASRPTARSIAYSAAYDGNTDVYVVPVAGGEPVRLTYHPMADRVVGWTPDGKRVLFASGRESGRQRYSQFFTVGLDGGLPGEAARAVRRVRRVLARRRSSSSTCRCRRTSATGSGTAAAGRPTCGCST